ncbi:MAG: MOSC N-terminal beta barrel domain-containing protein, partial [Cyclobacteriaceae bacterium]
MLTLSEIWIYPVKSLGGIRVDCAKVLGKGLEYDRRYMLVDENHQFMTQRFMPEMARFKLAFGVDNFRISHNEDTLEIPKSFDGNGSEDTYSIWADTVQGRELGDKFNSWFSEKLNLKCKLIYFPEDSARMVDQNYAVGGEQVSLADGYPFLIIGQSSVDDLNRRLDEAVPMNRFRPNFVFKGGAPYEEDSWRNFKIGAN